MTDGMLISTATISEMTMAPCCKAQTSMKQGKSSGNDRPLFEALGASFRLVFVSNSTQSFQFARDIFVRSLSATQHGRESRQLARFFWLRKMAEEKRFKELVQKDVVEWQRGLKRYSSPEYQSQYQSWKQTGKLPEEEPQLLVHDPGRQFETFLAVPNVVRLGP